MADAVSLRVGDTLGHYELVEQIGQGGMGVVYRARDIRLRREVAIKVLVAQRTTDPQWLARFEREAQAVAALSHPNILALYDFASDRGVWYAVTELLRGATLRKRLAEGALPVAQAVDYAVQIARGLAAAHDQGIVHQDLKPENILVTSDGQVKILDFGVATIGRAGSSLLSGDSPTTMPSVDRVSGPVGTVAYMSPEQLRGHAVDHRADLFAFGVTLYEMLTGRHPFHDGSSADRVGSILRDAPPSLATLNPAVSPSLERVVLRCLEKSVVERFQSARDIRFALEAVDHTTGTAQIRSLPHAASIAVLPFRDMSPGKDQDSFCEGLSEEIITALARVPGLRVVARTSAFQFKGQAGDLRRIGEALHVATVLDGSVRKAGDRMRITAELLDAANGYHIWTERFDRNIEDVFAVQEEIAETIVSTLKGRLAAHGEAELVRPGTKDLEAYLLSLEGRYHWNRRTEAALVKSAACFEGAVARDPHYAEAHVGLADALITLGTYGARPPHDVMPKAGNAVNRALEINPELAGAYVSRGCVRAVYEWSWAEAAADFERAITLNQAHPTARHWYAINHLVPTGRFDEAYAELRRALELDPLSLAIKASLGIASYFAGSFTQALSDLSKAIEFDETFTDGRLFHGLTLAAVSRWDDARVELEAVIRLSGRGPEALAALGYLSGMAGDQVEARGIILELEGLAERRYVSPSMLAQVHAGLGETDRALDRLEQACAVRAADMAWLRVRPVFATLRGEPRFVALLRRMNTAQDRQA
jgi:serine/threonine-protein kinase